MCLLWSQRGLPWSGGSALVPGGLLRSRGRRGVSALVLGRSALVPGGLFWSLLEEGCVCFGPGWRRVVSA